MGRKFAKKYEFIELLGRGAMCSVYKARQLLFDRVVAIKVLRPALAARTENRLRFLREARHCAQLDHPNILTLYDVDEYRGVPFIAMQYVDGPNLERLLGDGLALERGMSILSQVARALACAHAEGLLHRDLKPANILTTREGEVKVADWGLSKSLGDLENLTGTGLVVGTPVYMSPEQIEAQPLTEKADLYSLGVILYRLVTGALPFCCETVGEYLRGQLDLVPPSVLEKAPSTSPALARLIHRLLEKRPSARPVSATRVAEKLEQLTS